MTLEQGKKNPLRRSVCIAALRGGSGKTILSLGITAAWKNKGNRVAVFKKGPDFIDPGWLCLAGDGSCYNLDPFLMKEEQIITSFLDHSEGADISVIEGNRGIFDGMDIDGCSSTAELAKLLFAPVIILLDVTMSTRTVAAILKGLEVFDTDLCIGGVILNRVAGARQETLIRKCIERYCDTPVLGAIPRLKENLFPERHMGLVPYQEREHSMKAISWAEKIVKDHIDLDEIWDISCRKDPLMDMTKRYAARPAGSKIDEPLDIGIIRDRSFWFYYPENLDELKRMGGRIIEMNALSDPEIARIDALYIGGGFPETQAAKLSANSSFRDSLKEAIEKGLPVYAECGGFMYLGEDLVVDGTSYPMVGALPVSFTLRKRPQGHGYTILEVDKENPYYEKGFILKGHEFHYSEPTITDTEKARFVFSVKRGGGVHGDREGMCRKNVLATYSHVHAAGNPFWAKSIIRQAMEYKRKR